MKLKTNRSNKTPMHQWRTKDGRCILISDEIPIQWHQAIAQIVIELHFSGKTNQHEVDDLNGPYELSAIAFAPLGVQILLIRTYANTPNETGVVLQESE